MTQTFVGPDTMLLAAEEETALSGADSAVADGSANEGENAIHRCATGFRSPHLILAAPT